MSLFASAAGAEGEGRDSEVRKLIELLKNGDFDERQDAEEKLRELGEAARRALGRAVKEGHGLEFDIVAGRLLAYLSGATLVVQALDVKGNPLAGKRLGLTIHESAYTAYDDEGRETKPQWVQTDPHGQARFKGLKPGASHLRVRLDDADWKPSHGQVAAQYLMSGMNYLPRTFKKGGSVKGHVRDLAGKKPLGGASVLLIPDRGQCALPNAGSPDTVFLEDIQGQDGEEWASVSDPQGAFTVHSVPSGAYLAAVKHDDLESQVVAAVRVEEGRLARLNAPLSVRPSTQTHGKIKIRVMGADGKPLKKATVYVEPKRLPMPGALVNARERFRAHVEEGHEWVDDYKIPEYKTDEDGYFESVPLRSGSYFVTFRMVGAALVTKEKVVVRPGGTTDLSIAFPNEGGRISGKLDLGADAVQARIWAFNHADPESRFLIAHPSILSEWVDLYEPESQEGHWHRAQRPYNAVAAVGLYEFQHLPTGTYSLCLLEKDTHVPLGFIHGVEVKAGQIASPPKFKLATNKKRLAHKSYSGVVYLPNGEPAEGVDYMFNQTDGSATGSITGEDGAFSYDADPTEAPAESIDLEIDGYVSVQVDLEDWKHEPANIKVHLKKRAYGRLRVTVLDTDGRPIAGAHVFPASALEELDFRRSPDGKVLTSDRGMARIKKIPAGKVRLKVVAYGYYLDKIVVAEADQKEERNVKVTMLTGLTLKGQVRLPKDATLNGVWVMCDRDRGYEDWHGHQRRMTQATRDGKFEIAGLTPGEYEVEALVPGWRCPDAAKVTLKTGKKPDPVSVSLVRSGGFRVDFGRAYRGASVSFCEPGEWKPEGRDFPGFNDYSFGADNSHYGSVTGELTLDALGRGGRFGITPGTFDFVFSLYAEDPGRSTVTSRIVSSVRVPPLKGGWNEWRSSPPLKIRPVPANCEAFCRVQLKAEKRKLFGNFKVILSGKQAFSESPYLWFEGGEDPWASLKVVGEPPVRGGHGYPARFRFRGLPAGEYRLLLRHDTELWLPPAVLEKHPDLKQPLKKLEHARVVPVGDPVRLTDGKALDLGRIGLDVPPELLKLKLRIERLLKEWEREPE